MITRRGYRRCRALVAELALPRPFSVTALVRGLAERRGRPIDIGTLPAGLTVNACGAWLQLDTRDVIFVEANTTPFHRDHIVLHEIGHMLCDHRGGPLDIAAELGRFLPDLSPALVRRLLARTSYSTDEEQEAELVASLIRTAAQTQAPGGSTGALSELEAALGLWSR
ncbi:ImmA/IrrE family metallo-endopeptidase [Actinokineospora sp. NBRC 105648]|uniref:ImmA/IrrE family metallo-endopeptidase n=1 Tax=Actinokineospora sp. NBRC 105648 TaxID=3032206 RepID=UPI0025538E91|nr:ImmA/IrrE family metallo-endopeptidase [Actinokineospora sp. NBRC 105648]